MSDEHYPTELLYHAEHDWARVDGGTATFGITWYAQNSLGEIVFWEAPKIGATLRKDDAYAELESVKAVTDIVAPMSGEVFEVNDRIAGELTLLNEDPYGDGWLVRVRLSDPSEGDQLMDVETYMELL
jgi:glycine cleavage system H protein